MDIQTAMVRYAEAVPNRSHAPRSILWNGQEVWTSYDIVVPAEGRLRLELLSEPRQPLQGVDVKAVDGVICLAEGERVHLLRTWHDPRYDEVVEYPYVSKAGLLKVWNVYQWHWPSGRVTEEKWTGNAGFLVEQEGPGCWLFRCSDGPSESPDFTRLVFRFSVRSSIRPCS